MTRVINARKQLERAARAVDSGKFPLSDLVNAAREFRDAIQEREERRAKRVSK